MPRITHIILRRKYPKPISLSNSLSDSSYNSRLRLLNILIQQRQIAIFQFLHLSTITDNLLCHISHLAVKGLRP